MAAGRRFEAVVFDFDGVLADSERVHCETLGAAFAGYLDRTGQGEPPWKGEALWERYRERWMGLSDADCLRAMASEAGAALPEGEVAVLAGVKAALFERRVEDGRVGEIPGSADFVRVCAAEGPVALCSGAVKSDTAPLLRQFGLAGIFTAEVTAEDTERSKPDPAPYRECLARLGVAEPSACMAVEDTPDGVESACGAGLPVLGLATMCTEAALKEAGARAVVASLAGLTPAAAAALLEGKPRDDGWMAALEAAEPEEAPAAAAEEAGGDLRGERLQKVLAAAGVASRRHCADIIAAGQVTVDGKVVREAGMRVRPGARIEVDGRRIHAEPHRYYLVDKPRGLLCTSDDPQGRETLLAWARRHGADPRLRLYTIGRLDGDSEGLILLTNDGAFSQALAHPRHHVEKEYMVWIHRPLTQEDVRRMKHGIQSGGDRLRVLAAENAGPLPGGCGGQQVYLTLGEGKNRHIRRMMDAMGIQISRLRRVRIGFLSEASMRGRPVRELEGDEVERFRAGWRRLEGPRPGGPGGAGNAMRPRPPERGRGAGRGRRA